MDNIKFKYIFENKNKKTKKLYVTLREVEKNNFEGYIQAQKEIGYHLVSREIFIGIKDKNKKDIYTKDKVKGFGRKFTVRFGVIEREIVNDNEDINMVQIPSFYFEWEHQSLYPIVNNYKGKNDLETLEII